MVGAGYSAVDQAVIMGQISQQNFLVMVRFLSLKASLGSTTNDIDLSFTEPWLFDLPHNNSLISGTITGTHHKRSCYFFP